MKLISSSQSTPPIATSYPPPSFEPSSIPPSTTGLQRNMAPIEEEHEHYHPKDAVHLGLKGAAVVGGIGLLFAAVRTSLARKNVGPWAIFTRNGKLAATFGTQDDSGP